ALASGCNSTPPPRDYHEYSDIRAGQRGMGDAVGTSMASQDSMGYRRVANPRYTPPRQNDVAGVSQD
ncbi:MAG TPA: hypothetical protein VGP99_12230, partial [Tepidisphaeraceae bacterium]|nr:hypothetical protein [Tepidisphaeraceae bacterium]